MHISYNAFMRFAEILKALRKQHEYTQKHLADIIKIQSSNISDWENDVSRPEYEHLIKLAEIFDVTVGQLLGVEE